MPLQWPLQQREQTRGQGLWHEIRTKPALRVPLSELQAEKGRASMTSLEQLGPDLIPNDAACRVNVVGVKPHLQLLQLQR